MASVIVAPAAPATAAEPSAALGFRACLIDSQGAPAGIAAVECGDGSVRFAVVWHFHEAEAARPTGVTVSDHGSTVDRAVGLEPLSQVSFGSTEREVSNKYFLHENSFEFRLWLLGTAISGSQQGYGLLAVSVALSLALSASVAN
jgi:hypothetical protein